MSIIQQDLMIQKARPVHATSLSAVLTAGFQDDPVFAWAMPDDDGRRAALPALFDAFVAGFAPLGQTFTTRTVAGAALWAPPGTAAEPELDEAWIADWPRMGAVVEVLESTHPHEPCWYLNLLAVEPSAQGNGIGSALLRAVTEKADAVGERCYLDATSEHNVRLYERHGFVVSSTIVVGDGCPPLWAMWRDPA
jgi:GNAT superfamily N-acetyltransferase